MSQRQAVTKAKARAHARTDRAKKTMIFDELVELMGWHRDYVRTALREALRLKVVRPRAPRGPTYGPRIMVALVKCWAVLRAPAGKRLAPMLPVRVATASWTSSGPPRYTDMLDYEPALTNGEVYPYDHSHNSEGAGGFSENVFVEEYTLLEQPKDQAMPTNRILSGLALRGLVIKYAILGRSSWT